MAERSKNNSPTSFMPFLSKNQENNIMHKTMVAIPMIFLCSCANIFDYKREIISGEEYLIEFLWLWFFRWFKTYHHHER